MIYQEGTLSTGSCLSLNILRITSPTPLLGEITVYFTGKSLDITVIFYFVLAINVKTKQFSDVNEILIGTF